jgi:predicted DNA-binding protein (MmcQ/YjbR family)
VVTVESFRQLALSFSEAYEAPHFELTSFRVNKKIFATLDEKRNRACLILSEIDQSVFCSYDKAVIYPVPNKWGQKGATYVELKSITKSILMDMLEKSHDKITVKKPKKIVGQKN